MARSRNIKPGIFKNELLGVADPLLTILFAGLWCLADKRGRLEDRPLRIKAEIFPYRELPDFNGYLTELARLGFIRRYSIGGQDIIDIPAFEKHQHPHHTEKESELPEFSDSCILTVKAPLQDGKSTVPLRLIPDSLNTDSLILNTDSPPRAKAQKQPLDYSCWPSVPEPTVLADWLAMRKRMKADVSQTVINQFGPQLHEAGRNGYSVTYCLAECIASNWRGFKFSWLKNQEANNAKNQRSNFQTRGERNEQAFRDYLANIPQDGPDSGVLAALIGPAAGK